MAHPLPRAFVTAAIAGLCAATAFAAGEPFSQATVTRLQNKVTFVQSAKGARQPAQSGDVVKASSYLLTETDSRAELKYPDGSIVRIGQNTVFTFEADTRTLSLERGSLLFYIPKGHGGGTIRTASLTCAVTGTIGKVADNMIAILEGEVTLQPSGQKVPAGYFAQRNPDGSITVSPFDPTSAMSGKLMDFGGPIANFDENRLLLNLPASGEIVRDIMRELEIPDRMQNFPGAQDLFLPRKPDAPAPKEDKPKFVPTPPPARATPTTRPNGSGGTSPAARP